MIKKSKIGDIEINTIAVWVILIAILLFVLFMIAKYSNIGVNLKIGI